MSATGRGAERKANDLYETPGWVTRSILPYLPLGGQILEPAAGRGAIIRELLSAGVEKRDIHAIDIDPELVTQVRSNLGCSGSAEDFLQSNVAGFDLIITNPPYSLAQVFCEKALRAVRPGGTVAMLLRLPFLEGRKRIEFHHKYPADVYVLPKRPSFTGSGTDATAYGWFVWAASRGNRWFPLPVAA